MSSTTVGPARLIQYPHDRHPVAPETATREAELGKLLGEAVQHVARHVLIAVPPMQRTRDESAFLSDCARGRRGGSSVTLARLLDIQSRAESPHAMSEYVRAIELRYVKPSQVDVFDAMEDEEAASAALGLAKLLLAREKSGVRASQVVEAAQQGMWALRRLTDAASLYTAKQHKESA